MLEFHIDTDNYTMRSWQPPDITNAIHQQAAKEANGLIEKGFLCVLIVLKTSPYIDALLFDGETEHRFVFTEGYRWPYKDELLFLNMCVHSASCGYQFEQIDQIFRYYASTYPQWHLKRYYTKPFRLLHHIYHCFVRNTPQEILYKAGLDLLAENFDCMDEYDLLSQSPSDLFEGLSIRSLRALNCRTGAELLSKRDRRTYMKSVQGAFPMIFRQQLNDAQCRYIEWLIEEGLTVDETGRLFSSGREKLSLMWHPAQYELFISKERKKEDILSFRSIDPIYEKYIGKAVDYHENSRYQILYRYLVTERTEYDRRIRQANRKRNPKWQERHNDYIIRYPQTINDFCREAIYMRNCLLGYAEAMTNSDTTILFMRKANDVNKPFITLEVFGNELKQAYHRFDERCTNDELQWIFAYCKRHGIGTDTLYQ